MTPEESEYDMVTQHLHCRICGKAIPSEEEFCSDVCKDRMDAMVRKRKTYNYVFLALMAFLILMLVLSSMAPA